MKTLRSLWNALTSIGAPDIKRADGSSNTTPTTPTQKESPVPPSPTGETFDQRLERADTLTKCIRLYQAATPNSSDEERVISKIQKLALTFDDWYLIANTTVADSHFGRRALERLESFAVSFKHRELLHELASKDAALSPLKFKCLISMRNLAQTIGEWRKVYELSDPSSGEHSLALHKLCGLAAAGNAWEDVTDGLPDEDPLHARALEERLKLVTSLQECETLYDELAEGHALIPALLEKLRACTEPIGDWIDMYSNRDSLGEFSDALLEKAIALAATPSDYVTLMEAAESAHETMQRQFSSLLKMSNGQRSSGRNCAMAATTRSRTKRSSSFWSFVKPLRKFWSSTSTMWRTGTTRVMLWKRCLANSFH
ncbi:MAG: hypothetical protein Q7S86_02420 [bacterium]|nr:hypothetical protein [bacterium]